MKSFLIALQFLTIILVRLKHVDEKKIADSTAYFPLVGLLLGLILTGADRFLSFLGFEQFFISVILVVLLIILTGGIHLDGLADTADAFLSMKNKEETLRIMRDSRIGVMGVLSLISVILLKIAFLSCLGAQLKISMLLLMCILSRWAMVFSMFLFPYARVEGKAKDFIRGTDLKLFIFSSVITLFCVVKLCGIQGLALSLIIAAIVYVTGRLITNKIGGITGDTLGATNELVETGVLFGICILERIGAWII